MLLIKSLGNTSLLQRLCEGCRPIRTGMRTCMHGHRCEVPSHGRRLVHSSVCSTLPVGIVRRAGCYGPAHLGPHALSASKQRQKQTQATAGGQTAVTNADASIESVISDVLNANRARIQRPVSEGASCGSGNTLTAAAGYP